MSFKHTALSRAWTAVLSQGAHPLGTLRSRVVMGLNRYCLIAGIAYFPVATALVIHPTATVRATGAVAWVMIAVWALGPLLNRLRWHRIALIVSLVVPSAGLTIMTFLMSVRSGFFLPLVALTGLAFIVLMPEQRWWRAAFAIVSAALLMTIFTVPGFDTPGPGVSDTTVVVYAVTNVVLVLLLVYVVAWYNSSYFVRERRRNEKLLEAAHNAAQTDSLTEVLNRRGISPVMSDIARNGPYSVALADLDRFKRINDRLGHGAGDVVLANVARTLVKAVGADGTVGRWGGEEFVVVIPGTSMDHAAAVMERARRAIELEYSNDEVLEAVTLSVGVYHGARFTPKDEMLKHADALLYQAKKRGRNQVRSGAASAASARREEAP